MKHPHAELMLEYAKDAMETDKPWERWQYCSDGQWKEFSNITTGPCWYTDYQYRRKPKPYEPTLLDQALELEIEAAKLRIKGLNPSSEELLQLNNNLFELCKSRSLAMREHLKSQGKL